MPRFNSFWNELPVRRSRLSGITLGIWREALVTSYDPEYKATKLIKQGKAALEPVMADMADWVASRWQVTVLNVIYDQIDASHNRRPRLQVIVEHSHECQAFFDGHNFDPLKQQAVAARFAELVNQQQPTRYDVDGLFVVFSAFAPLARREADSQIADREVNALQERIANPQLWTIHRCFGRVTFMFYTDEQARTHAQAGLREPYADRYFELLQKHDGFKYLHRARFSVEFDSKEKFEKNHGASWFYYDR